MSTETLSYPTFSLSRLLNTVFRPQGGERMCILIDLDEPKDITDFAFLQDSANSVQKHAYETFYQGLRQGDAADIGLQGAEIYAYKKVGGSNLDLPDACWGPDGKEYSLERDVYTNFDIILCISTYSATAPLTAFAKQYGFRGATMHGMNDIILSSGLCVDYEDVSAEAEKLRLGMTRADAVEMDFELDGEDYMLRLELGKQEAQKSHGLCQGGPDIANLPAGEVYFVPTGGAGEFPFRYDDGTLAIMKVSDGYIRDIRFVRGDESLVKAHREKLASDPKVGEIGELGFGTQVLPVSGSDIQDEKIRGTFHVATGRSDHLGGNITPDQFNNPMNASHDDILYAPSKTPEISAPQVRLYRDGEVHVLIENFETSDYLNALLAN